MNKRQESMSKQVNEGKNFPNKYYLTKSKDSRRFEIENTLLGASGKNADWVNYLREVKTMSFSKILEGNE